MDRLLNLACGDHGLGPESFSTIGRTPHEDRIWSGCIGARRSAVVSSKDIAVLELDDGRDAVVAEPTFTAHSDALRCETRFGRGSVGRSWRVRRRRERRHWYAERKCHRCAKGEPSRSKGKGGIHHWTPFREASCGLSRAAEGGTHRLRDACKHARPLVSREPSRGLDLDACIKQVAYGSGHARGECVVRQQ